MSEQTNTIKRIYDILKIVTHYGDANTSLGSSASIAWTAALEIGNSEDLNNPLCDLITDVGGCERIMMRDRRINKDAHLKHISKVKAGLLCVHLGNWETFRKVFDDGFLDILLLMSENMSMYISEEIIPEQEIADLQADVEDVINTVVDSNLENELKRVLYEGLEAVRQAIINYQMFGTEGIRNAVDRNLGAYARYYQCFENISDNEGKQTIHAYKRFINKANAVVSSSLKLLPLVNTIIQVFPMLEPASENCT